MIGYEELVEALAAWRTRQGLAETGSDYLGVPDPFPEYRVAQPEARSYVAGSESEVEGDVVYDESEPSELSGADQLTAEAEYSADNSYEAVEGDESYEASADDDGAFEQVEAADELEATSFDEEIAADDDIDADEVSMEVSDDDDDDYAVNYDDQTDANVDVDAIAAAGAAAEEAAEFEQEVDVQTSDVEAEEALGEEVEFADADAVEETVDVDAQPLYAADEATEIGIGVEHLQPGANMLAEDLDDAIDNVEIDGGDSVSYDEDDDEKSE